MKETDKLLYGVFVTEDKMVEVRGTGESVEGMIDPVALFAGIMNIFVNIYIDTLPESEQLEGERKLKAAFNTLFEQRYDYIVPAEN